MSRTLFLTNFKQLHRAMRKHMRNFSGELNDVGSVQAKIEVANNMSRLESSPTEVKENLLLYYLLSRPEFRDIDKRDAISWIRYNRRDDCDEIVRWTIDLTYQELEDESRQNGPNIQFTEAMIYQNLKDVVDLYREVLNTLTRSSGVSRFLE